MIPANTNTITTPEAQPTFTRDEDMEYAVLIRRPKTMNHRSNEDLEAKKVLPRRMTFDEMRRIAYDALTEMDELLDEYEADEEPCRELVSIRAKLFKLASGVVWEDMQPKEVQA